MMDTSEGTCFTKYVTEDQTRQNEDLIIILTKNK